MQHCFGLTGPQGAPRDTYQEVGKDRENAFQFKASPSEPHTAPAENTSPGLAPKILSKALSAAAHWI